MADYATKGDVQNIVDKAVGKAVEDLSEVIYDMGQRIHEELVPIKKDIKQVKLEVRDNTKSIIRLKATNDAILDALIEDKAGQAYGQNLAQFRSEL